MVRGAYYYKTIRDFLKDPVSEIRDALTMGNSKSGFNNQLKTQTDSWSTKIAIFKNGLANVNPNWVILFEYSIPRRAKRVDAIIIANDIILVTEYKDVDKDYSKSYITQVEDYCLDIRDFHKESNNKVIVPILLCSKAKNKPNILEDNHDSVKQTFFSNADNFGEIIKEIYSYWGGKNNQIDYKKWYSSPYSPTPTIIEAAKALYAGQSVKEITRSHSEAENLSKTTNAVLEALSTAQKANKKIICFITGVPGAGKTLAGLNIVHSREYRANKELAVFLSGNSPLVKVLNEALARGFSQREGIPKTEARRRVSTFIHNVHQFIDEYYLDENLIPIDNVIIYDEAQRAWDREHKFRKSNQTIDASEPDILLSIMDRFKNKYSAIIALVGGGQEINTGEGGLAEWGKAIIEKYSHWDVYISDALVKGDHSTGNMTLFKDYHPNINLRINSNLHLNVSIRAYKAEKLSEWVSLILSSDNNKAAQLFKKDLINFPVFISRSIDNAKKFLKKNVRGSRRYGLVASSGGNRLRAVGIDIASGLSGISKQEELGAWYLNPTNDIRSSNFLEIVAREYAVQGLELDWVCVCWDADLRRESNEWKSYKFSGTSWNNVNQPEQQKFILNKYRVLLTRAREGMIIYVPHGDNEDETRRKVFYDSIYNYLKSCGVPELE